MDRKPTSKSPTILIRLDAYHQIGLAHAVRTSAILNALAEPAHLHVLGKGPFIKKFFPPSTTVHHFHDNTITEDQQALETIELCHRIGANLLLCDQPQLTRASWQRFIKAGLPTIAIDDYGGDLVADKVINGTVVNDYHNYPHMEVRNIYCGPEYALISPLFAQITPRPEPKALLLVIGSGDRAKEWALALTETNGPINNLGCERVTIVVGGAFPAMAELASNTARLGVHTCQNISHAEMAELFTSHTIALTTGGMIVYEALAAGIPLVAYPQEKNLVIEANWFEKHGALVNLGFEGGMDMSRVHQAIKRLLINATDRAQMAAKGRNLIDGRGLARAATLVDELLTSR